MLRSLFIIFFFQLLGEAIQKFFEINIPGPVIGLVLLLLVFIFFLKSSSQFKKIKKDIFFTSHQIINYLNNHRVATAAVSPAGTPTTLVASPSGQVAGIIKTDLIPYPPE